MRMNAPSYYTDRHNRQVALEQQRLVCSMELRRTCRIDADYRGVDKWSVFARAALRELRKLNAM